MSGSQRYLLLSRALDLSSALPSGSGSFTPVDAGTQWKQFAASTAGLVGSDVTEMVAILRAPALLDDGTIIVQEFNDAVGERTSAAACTPNGPRILYDPNAIAGLLPPGLRFLKAHELAHLALQHIKCSQPPVVRAGYREKEADCRAVSRLLASGDSGRDAIISVAQYFRSQNDPAQGPYESSQARSSYIYHHCSP